MGHPGPGQQQIAELRRCATTSDDYVAVDECAIIDSNLRPGDSAVAQLIVRKLPDTLVAALKRRAAAHNRSAEEEHREILRTALSGPRRRSLAEALERIPDVGEDDDFEREHKDRRA